MPEYRRGTGPDALPQGAATRLNALTPRMRPEDAGYQDNTVPVQWARGNEPDMDEGDDAGLSENMQVLLSPHDVGYRAPVMSKQRPNRVPAYVVRHLPEALAASRMPDAPPALRAMFNSTIRYLENEGRA
jgi:hypothetical protein